MSDMNITKRVEPSIHSSTLDNFRIVNKEPPKSAEADAERKALARGETPAPQKAPPPRPAGDGQPIRTQARTVTLQGAPIEVQMGGSGAVVVRRPPPPIGAIGGAPRAVDPMMRVTNAPAPAGAAAAPTLTLEQVKFLAALVEDHLDRAGDDVALNAQATDALGALESMMRQVSAS